MLLVADLLSYSYRPYNGSYLPQRWLAQVTGQRGHECMSLARTLAPRRQPTHEPISM